MDIHYRILACIILYIAYLYEEKAVHHLYLFHVGEKEKNNNLPISLYTHKRTSWYTSINNAVLEQVHGLHLNV